MNAHTHTQDQGAKRGTGTILELVLVWGVVGIPLLWGIIETGANALKLFR